MTSSIDIEELLGIEPQEQGCSFIKTQKQMMLLHQVFLDENIGEPKKYRDLINMLYLADENTEFNFLINSPGGTMTAAIAIIEGIRGSDGAVRAIINGECHSAASIIALNCNEVFVTDHAHMLIHTAQYGTGGFTQNVKAHADFSTQYINKILDSTYTGFLSIDELDLVKQGVEMWFDADQIRERLKGKHAYLLKKHTEAKEEAELVKQKKTIKKVVASKK